MCKNNNLAMLFLFLKAKVKRQKRFSFFLAFLLVWDHSPNDPEIFRCPNIRCINN